MMGTPRATYRLQLHAEFGFDAAAAIAPYLRQLGISHVYTSPYLQARPGSTHGYDVVNHRCLSSELGGAAAHARMIEALRSNELGHIVDLVPNHMGVGGSDNPLWLDVLEWGPESRYAGWFDIDWDSHHRYLQGKILVPFLGEQYGAELAAGHLQLRFDSQQGDLSVWASDTHKLPICPLHYEVVLGELVPALEILGDDFAALGDWRPDMFRRADVLKQQLAALVAGDADAATALTAALRDFNAAGLPGPREALHALIQQQHWRACHFRVAGDDINYRRFFNVNELAGIRVELPAVFDHTHRLVLQLASDGAVDGLRIDHIDGLMDPAEYLARLLEAWNTATEPARTEPYLVVEKILAQDERLPEGWAVDGSTGYDFCALALQLLVDPAGETALTEGYNAFIGKQRSFDEVLRDSKLRVMDNEMGAELKVLARAAARVARLTPLTADFTSALLSRALRAVIACLPVYRTYVHSGATPSIEDLQRVGAAIESARRFEWELDASVFTFLERLLTGQLAEPRSGYVRHRVLRCAMRMQQYSGPVMAKGQEDTAFYRYNRFIALNEVGSNPAVFGLSMKAWHRAMSHRARYLPRSMLATSTHDTKRGEDARARLAVLAELPDEWLQNMRQWKTLLLNAAALGDSDIDANDFYGFMQTMLGSCPDDVDTDTPDDLPSLVSFRQRLSAAIRKSLREAKVHTTWTTPDEHYEQRVLRLFEIALRPQVSRRFWQSFAPFMRRVARLGVNNSLVLLTLKLTAPGVPDVYQGCENWNFSMVDPDNRRSIDYEANAALLQQLTSASACDRLNVHDGRIKLWLTHRLLRLRAQREALFREGDYLAVTTLGRRADDICAYARQKGNAFALVLTARFPSRVAEGWRDTRLSLPPAVCGQTLHDALTGRVVAAGSELRVEEALDAFPLAVFVP